MLYYSCTSVQELFCDSCVSWHVLILYVCVKVPSANYTRSGDWLHAVHVNSVITQSSRYHCIYFLFVLYVNLRATAAPVIVRCQDGIESWRSSEH